MKFNKVYIEITNICGLECSFCPTKTLQNTTMDLSFFESILTQVTHYTKTITFHIFGDPLVLSNLVEYLNLAHKYNLKVELVTTGYYLHNFDLDIFLHPAIKQINFSLNSFDKNNMDMSLEQYLKPMIDLSKLKIIKNKNMFINFRLWNLSEKNELNNFNNKIYKLLSEAFKVDLSNINSTKPIRLDNKVLINFDYYFSWPTLNSTHYSHASCYGLKSHFGILSSGVVVPCCLDSFGIINLGNLHLTSLKEILNSKRTQNIIKGFKNNTAIEELCQKCSFKDRFIQT